MLDPELWEQTKNPYLTFQSVSQTQLEKAACASQPSPGQVAASVDADQVAEVENFAVGLWRVANDGDFAADVQAWDLRGRLLWVFALA